MKKPREQHRLSIYFTASQWKTFLKACDPDLTPGKALKKLVMQAAEQTATAKKWVDAATGKATHVLTLPEPAQLDPDNGYAVTDPHEPGEQ